MGYKRKEEAKIRDRREGREEEGRGQRGEVKEEI